MGRQLMEINNYEKGFTLVELLVTMAIMGLIVAGIYNLFDVHNRMAAKQEETTLMQQELISLMVMMSNELRMCGYTPAVNAAANFGFIHIPGDFGRGTNSTSIYCRTDRNGNGVHDGANASEHSGYALNVANDGAAQVPPDNILRKYDSDTSSVKWQPMSMNIREINFTYFDNNGDNITDDVEIDPDNNLSRIRSVQINATAMASPERAGMNIPNRQMSTTVFCRNLAGR